MRELTDHKINECNEALIISAVDKPGSGGANHRYEITGFDTNLNPSNVSSAGFRSSFSNLPVIFQNGPIKEVGVNGVTHEVLLAIVIDRMRCFQNGNYSCRENSIALTHLETALLWLNKRTRDRIARNVEGTHQK